MAMMIVKFHKLIQSKVLWYIVLGVIIISFVGFFTPNMGNKSEDGRERVIAEMFGEKVTAREFRTAFSELRLYYMFAYQRQLDLTGQTADLVWAQLATLHKVEESGVVVSNEEVARRIEQIPAFMNQNGVFDRNMYELRLAQVGVSYRQAENMVRNQMAIEKLMDRALQAELFSPTELTRTYHLYTDKLILDYAVLTREDVAKDVSVTREDAQALYDEDSEPFRMPAKVRVSYVEYPVADFRDGAEISDEAALEYFKQNIEQYRMENEDPMAAVEYTPFEQVEAEIKDKLVGDVARDLASGKATELVAAVSIFSQDDKPDFKKAAGDAGLEVKSLPPFGPADQVPGIDPTSRFKNVALGLLDDGYNSYSDAIEGDEFVYVISLDQRLDSFVPPFETVESEVMELARVQAVSDTMQTRAEGVEVEINGLIEGGESFANAVATLGLTVETTDEFDALNGLEHPYFQAFVEAARISPEGTLCPVVPVEQGALITYVVKRTVSNPEVGLPLWRDDIVRGMSGVRSRTMIMAWQEALMKEADKQDVE